MEVNDNEINSLSSRAIAITSANVENVSEELETTKLIWKKHLLFNKGEYGSATSVLIISTHLTSTS